MLLFSLQTVVSANMYVDAFGAYTMAGDLDNQIGGGGSIATDVHQNVIVFCKGVYNSIIKNSNKPDEEQYSYKMALFGFQYLQQLAESPVYWTNALGVGLGQGSADVSENFVSTTTSDRGICFAYWTGLLLEATQYISPYIEVGYHKTMFYSDYENYNVSGFQCMVGVRITLFGKNRSIDARY